MIRAFFLIASFGALLGLSPGAAASDTATPNKPAEKRRVAEGYGKLPLSFEPNQGQTSPEVQWVARGPEYALFLSGHDAVLQLSSVAGMPGISGSRGPKDGPEIARSAVRMNLLGANATEQSNGEGQQAGTANYFTGNDPSKWQREVPNFEKVRLSGVYPGIDLVYYGRQGRLEYDFVVAPGADPSKIKLAFDGAAARLAGNGDLVLPVAGTDREVRFDRPTVYQVEDGKRQPVEGAFHLASDRTVNFALGSYDRGRELVIDPTLLFAGSLATGNQQTIPTGMVIDSAGAMYLTGYTNDLSFPVTTGAFQTNCQVPTSNGAGASRCGVSSSTSGFVTKISADGKSLVYSTYLHGGGGYEYGQSIVVDAAGDAYVLGATSSNDFPITANAYQSLCQPTYSSGAYFAPVLPIVSQCDNFADGGGTEYTVNGPNLFISKLNPTGTALLYSTFFGGSAAVYPEGIALDPAGNIYFASEVNQANSPMNLYPFGQHLPFPTTASGYQTVGIDVQTPALSKLSADGQTLMYSTFLGSQALGVGHDSFNQAFALGQNGVGFFGGFTATADFPTTAGAIKPTCGLNTSNGSYCFTTQGFVAAVDTTKTGAASLVYASYLGGEEQQGSNIPEQEVYGLAADANNNLFVTGYTYANDFPSTAGVYQPHCNDVNPTGSCDTTAFLSKINPAGSALTWSTFLGDTRDDGPGGIGTSVALDSKGQVYLYGLSNDGSGSFPQVDPISTYTSGNKVFLSTFSADATKLLFSTRFSGPSNNGISLGPSSHGLAVDAAGNMYIAGYTGDNGAFGTTAGTYSTTPAGGFNRPFFAEISRVTGQSATTLTITPVVAASGQLITFAASVAGDGSSTAIASGTVTLTASNLSATPIVLGTITLDATGNGTFSTNTLGPGTYSVQAAYSGDSNYEPSQSMAQTLLVKANLTGNLLANPGAELGSLADWTIVGPGTPQVDTGTFDSGINPHTGTYDFLGHDGATDSLTQTVSIVQQGITADQIDGGTLSANVSFWEQGLNQGTTSDDGSVSLTFLDANNAALSTVTTSTVDSHDGTWANGTGVYAIPVGTRSITYAMNFMRNDGSDLDTFIDDNVLSLATNTGLSLFPGTLHFGNVAVGSRSGAQQVLVSNQQTTTINIQQIVSELGANPSDFIETDNCPAALAAGASCTLTITFVPDGVGAKSAGVAINTDSVPALQAISVDGTGTGGILQVNPGNLKTIAGIGTAGSSGDGGPATVAQLNQPNGVAFDPSGNLYIADDRANVVRKVDTAGNISTFAGVGTGGFTGDGGLATAAELSIPFSVTSDKNGNIYIQDTGNDVIRKVDAQTGIITTFAGTPQTPGHLGDGGPATAARFNQNQGARFDSAGNMYVPTCLGPSVRKIDTAGNISTVAGNFTGGFSGDGGPATAAMLQCPSGVTIDAAGNLYIADEFNQVIRKVNTAGVISTIAGTPGMAGFAGDGGAATAAKFTNPNDVVIDTAGNLYVADSGNNRVRKIDTDGVITTAVGGLDNAGSAAVNTPLAVTLDTAGNVYFSDAGNSAVREIFPQGVQPFPATQVGSTSAAQSLTLSNIGNTDVTLAGDGAFTLRGNAGDFALTPGSCAGGTILTANGGSCAVSLTFTPTATGSRVLTVLIGDNALNAPQSFSIGGTGVAAAGQPQTPVITWAMPAAITTATALSGTQLDATATDANGAAIPGTFVYTPAAGAMLPAGTQTLSVTFTPTDATVFTTATQTTTIVVTQAGGGTPVGTTTSFLVSAGEDSVTTVAAGTVVVLSATVTAGTAPVAPGQVAFCDAAAAACTETHRLGTAQLITSQAGMGTAVYRFVPGIGTHSYKAIFLGTTAAAGSTSAAAPLTVTGTYPTATTIAQSGAAGNFTLTATTVGTGSSTVVPTGTVSFLDTSNANAVLGTGALGASTSGFALVQAAGSPVGVGSGAYGVATGDFNGDGFADVAVENYNAGTVSVLLGKGDGTFETQATYSTGALPERVVTADLNGDGILDLIVANTGSNTISVLLGNGDGTFQDQVTYPAGSPVGLGVMDVNHDGIPDVVAGDYYQNTMSVLLGNGDGTLKTAVTYATASTPQTVAEGDFNGDGNVDVVVGNEGGASVGVFLGNGDGTFQAIVNYAVGNSPQGLQVGDFNGDGKQDLAVSNQVDGTVGVLLGNGDGTFQAQVTYAAGVQPVGLAIADFNGDGIEDITVGNTGQASLTQSVLLGNGDGTFKPQVTFPTGNFPYGVAIADFNGDGLPDVVASNFTDATATVLLSQATETATASITGVAPAAGTHAVVASYPGDTHYKTSVSAPTNLIVAGITTTVITWVPAVATIPYGTALGASQLNATAATAAGVAVAGTFVYTPAAGAVLRAGTQTLSVAFMPTSASYSAATATATISVTQATPVITWAAPAGIAYGTPLSGAQLNATVAGVGTGALAGTLVYTPPAGTVLAPGTQTLSVTFTPTDAVDYTTATASVPIVVGGLSLSSLTPLGVLIGSADTKITLTGTGFVAASVVMVNGTGVATAYVSPTMLTAVIPAALLKTPGALAVTVADPAIGAASVAQTFAVLPPTGAATLTGPTTTDPGSQPSVTLSITNPYPVALTAEFTLTFASAGTTQVDDPSIQFSSGGRTYDDTVAANSTTVPPVQLQAGTIAGTITVTAKLIADGVDVTPAGLAPVVIVVPPVVPVISSTTITAAGNTLTVMIHGFSNTREVSSAEFDFTAATGETLATSTLTIPATTIFGTWYGDSTSDAYGSTFTYTQTFNTSGDASTIGSVKVTLTNSVGTSLVSTSAGP